MISKNTFKLIQSLKEKKYRLIHKLFVGEGEKVVMELLTSFSCQAIYCLKSWKEVASPLVKKVSTIHYVTEVELKKLSFMTTPQEVLGIFDLPTEKEFPTQEQLKNNLILALDCIQDPGNVGTIVRLADWFGITQIIASKDTADVFSPKCTQATMGALARVNVHYTDLAPYLTSISKTTPIYGTDLEGNNLYQMPLSENGVIILGNEGKGMSKELKKLTTHNLRIPHYPSYRQTVESLNVGIAASIVCAEFRRRTEQK